LANQPTVHKIGKINRYINRGLNMNNKIMLGVFAVFTQVACAQTSVWEKPTPALNQPAEMTVYRSPTCTCCEKWIAHMKQQGFTIKDRPSDAMDAIKQQHGVPGNLQSCHTALVGGYVIEGHVPAGDVKKLLTAKPATVGLAAPGMPVGSPGMDMDGRAGNFQVIQFDKSGKGLIFNTYTNH
jgi:hypothetical protein